MTQSREVMRSKFLHELGRPTETRSEGKIIIIDLHGSCYRYFC